MIPQELSTEDFCHEMRRDTTIIATVESVPAPGS